MVVDSSVFIAWWLGEDEQSAAAAAVGWAVATGGVVPGVWWYEVRNALLMSERRGRIAAERVDDILAAVGTLRLQLDDNHNPAVLLDLARRFRLTVYDAAYLEVALRRGLPLATLDRRLASGARKAGVVLRLEPPVRRGRP